MAKEKPTTKICKYCKTEIPYEAKICPNCRKRVKGGWFKKILLILLLLVIAIIAISCISSGNSASSKPQKVGTVGESSTGTNDNADNSEGAGASTDNAAATSGDTAATGDSTSSDSAEETKDIYVVGDILMDGDMKIVYVKSGVYNEDNQFSQPKDGYQYIYIDLAFENTGDGDDSVSFYSFDCYADGYQVDQHYTDDDVSATLSGGRMTEGIVCFEVPVDATEIEIEYETNMFTEEKIKFAYEGEKDSGFTLTKNTAATEGAFQPGDVVEVGDLTISYLSVENYESDNPFLTPRDGCHYVSLTFEVENTGDSDESISYYSFDCFADGIDCDGFYGRDDGLSATISSGRKAKGTVSFEVPDDATVVEVEYLENIWTSNRIVFNAKTE